MQSLVCTALLVVAPPAGALRLRIAVPTAAPTADSIVISWGRFVGRLFNSSNLSNLSDLSDLSNLSNLSN